MSLALLGLPKILHSYEDSVNGREKLSGWERLWSDLVQEEIRRGTRDGSSSNNEDEENFALATKERKGKGKKFPSKSEAKGKKQDLSKVKCFHFTSMGISPLTTHRRRRTRRLLELQLERPYPHNFNLISL